MQLSSGVITLLEQLINDLSPIGIVVFNKENLATGRVPILFLNQKIETDGHRLLIHSSVCLHTLTPGFIDIMKQIVKVLSKHVEFIPDMYPIPDGWVGINFKWVE